jgi:predicted pyridoxine 5'-phosphate oxidase superfamily flavin-nucleotide-binding protein
MTSHRITEEAALTAIIGEPMDFVRAKICSELNDAIRELIARSPLVFVSTIDAQGMLDVSPKGEPAGFTLWKGAGSFEALGSGKLGEGQAFNRGKAVHGEEGGR